MKWVSSVATVGWCGAVGYSGKCECNVWMLDRFCKHECMDVWERERSGGREKNEEGRKHTNKRVYIAASIYLSCFPFQFPCNIFTLRVYLCLFSLSYATTHELFIAILKFHLESHRRVCACNCFSNWWLVYRNILPVVSQPLPPPPLLRFLVIIILILNSNKRNS